MKVLESIFGHIIYSEVISLFDTLEELYLAIIQDLLLDLPKVATGEDVEALIEKQAEIWDRHIVQHQYSEEYRNQVRNIVYTIRNYPISEVDFIEKDKRWRLDQLSPLTRWGERVEKPYSYVQLLYYHQLMRQLWRLVEMYQRNGSRGDNTRKHLFEVGLKLVRVKEVDYLERVYDTNAPTNSLSFLKASDDLLKNKINWVIDAAKRDLTEKLYCNLKYAERAYRKQDMNGVVVETLKPYKVYFHHYKGFNVDGRFSLYDNLNGYVGYRESDKTIIVGFSGTEKKSLQNWLTDACQYFGILDPVYLQAAALVRGVWMGKSHKKGFENSKVIVCGHSLGGGLMQYAVSMMQKDDIEGYGYNSAGLAETSMQEIDDKQPSNVFHLYQPNDVVFTLKHTYQLGKSVKCSNTVTGACKAHKIETMREQTGRYRNDYVEVE